LPETFQQIINSIFQKLLHESILANYIDYFVILAKTIDKLEEQIICFLKVAEKHNLCSKQFKYNFNIEEILIPGVIIRREQVQMKKTSQNYPQRQYVLKKCCCHCKCMYQIGPLAITLQDLINYRYPQTQQIIL